ncbi:MAG: AAA family ATPase [Cetobacterium sp.]
MRKILESKDKHIVVQAMAGVGKSYTMMEYIKRNPKERILYMVFNKSMQLEFEGKLRDIEHNCVISTIHSIAFRWYLSKGYKKKALRNISIVDAKNILNTSLPYERISKILFYLNMYLASDLDDIMELTPIYPEDTINLKYSKKLYDYFSGDSSTFMSHNIYLKMYQLEKVPLEYDTILVDECNDCNSVMLGLITQNLDKKVIAIGDSYQSIMAFTHTVDGLRILVNNHGFKQYSLTKSFRVSNSVANLSAKYLNYIRGGDVKFSGVGTTKIARLNLSDAKKSDKIHLLCRTKLGGIKEIIELLKVDKNKKIYYVGGLKGFGIDEIDKVLKYRGSAFIGGQHFTIGKLRKMIKDGVEDTEISRTVAIHDFVGKNEDMLYLLKTSEVSSKSDADIIVLTSHVSKGLTLGKTLIAKDFPKIESTKLVIDATCEGHPYLKGLAEAEANLCYVAITRATDILDLGTLFYKDSSLKEDSKIESNIETNTYLRGYKM